MDPVYALVAGSGWASGLSVYLAVALVGLAGRLGLADVPDALSSWPVIGVAVGLYLVEFVADKIPYVDNAWDVLHTLVRPVGAALLGWWLAGHADVGWPAVVAAGSGGLALAAHAAKATARAAINTSPEPVSTVGASLAEDGLVLAVVWLAVTNPLVALALVAVLVIAGAAVVALLWRALGRVRARRGARRAGVSP